MTYDQLEDRRIDDVILLSFNFIKQVDSMLPRVFSVIFHRRRQCHKTIRDTLGYRLVCHFCS